MKLFSKQLLSNIRKMRIIVRNEMLELALHYLVLLEEYLGTEGAFLITTTQQLLMSINSEQESRNNEATHRDQSCD